MAEDEKLELLRSRFDAIDGQDLMDGELFSGVLELLNRVQPWFEPDADASTWFNTEVIVSFGLTPAEVIKLHGRKGLKALNEYISAKEEGGYE